MQYQAVSSADESSTEKKNLREESDRLATGAEATGALEFRKQIEQQRMLRKAASVAKNSQAKIIGQIVFQFGDAIFHVRPAIFRRERQVTDEDAESVTGNLQQFSS